MTMSITKERNRFIRCSLLSDCKNVQKSVLKSVNVQRTGKSILQIFAFSFFEGSHICRFLPILRPPTVPRSHFSYPKTKAFLLIIVYPYTLHRTNHEDADVKELLQSCHHTIELGAQRLPHKREKTLPVPSHSMVLFEHHHL